MKTLTLKSVALAATLISALTAACEATDATCGEDVDGVTCQATDGTCSERVCTSGNWECPANTTQVALVPGNCVGADAGACGEMPIGVTCQASDRTCVAQQCVSGTWACPVDTTPVDLAPSNCDGSSN